MSKNKNREIERVSNQMAFVEGAIPLMENPHCDNDLTSHLFEETIFNLEVLIIRVSEAIGHDLSEEMAEVREIKNNGCSFLTRSQLRMLFNKIKVEYTYGVKI